MGKASKKCYKYWLGRRLAEIMGLVEIIKICSPQAAYKTSAFEVLKVASTTTLPLKHDFPIQSILDSFFFFCLDGGSSALVTGF